MKHKKPKVATGAMSHIFMKGIVLVYVCGKSGYVEAYNRKLKRIVPISMFMANSFEHGKFKWGIRSHVTGRSQTGEEYSKGVAMRSEICRQADIAAFANDEHMKVVNGFNKEHQLTAAWIACPFGSNISDEESDEILTNCGAYEFLAKWEADK